MKLTRIFAKIFRKRSRKGVSLVESVIAITLVTIFSLSAISVSTMASAQTAKSMHSFAAASLSNDVRQCFSITDNAQDFKNALSACEYTYELLGERESEITVTFNREVFLLTVYITYDAGTDIKTMRAVATRPEISGTLYELEYTAPLEVEDETT